MFGVGIQMANATPDFTSLMEVLQGARNNNVDSQNIKTSV
jgi:hypothetical protein